MPFSEWFDRHPLEEVSFSVAQREWLDLQTAIQRTNGRSLLALSLAPVDSPQYRLARRLLRRRLLGRVRSVSSDTPVLDVELAPNWRERCAVVKTDHLDVGSFNQELSAGSTPWVLFASAHDSEDEIALLVSSLLNHAHDPRTTYFAGEIDEGSVRGIGPHTLLSVNAVGRGAIFPRNVLVAVGGLSHDVSDFEHDLVLRLSEAGYPFVGIPTQHSLTPSPRPRTETTVAALRRRGVTGIANQGDEVVTWSVMSRPSVDIVIPTRDRIDLLSACIDSVEQNCGNFAVTITIVDNGSVEPESHAYFSLSPHRIVQHPGEFNYAAIVNHGVASGGNDVVVVLNNDTVVRSGWLEGLVPLATLKDVGVVGATLVSPEGDVQHAGMAAVPYPVELPFGRIPNLVTGDSLNLSQRQTDAIRNVLAVTGACHVVERSKWERVEGMDETLRVTANDVDLCLRLNELGYYTVLNPHVVIEHVGKASRGSSESSDDHVRFLQRWGFLRELLDPCVPVRRANIVQGATRTPLK